VAPAIRSSGVAQAECHMAKGLGHKIRPFISPIRSIAVSMMPIT
jgi:hypothetical protein